MSIFNQAAPVIEERPLTIPIPAETPPADPDDSCGVDQEIIQEIEEIGRRYAEPHE